MLPTILIVDDSEAIHALVSSWFAGEPWHVCSAHSGMEGLRMAADRRADLVLLDVDLPDVNGFDICRSLRAAPETAGCPVIFLTGSSTSDETICGLQLGACDYITKPFDPNELVLRVRNALGHKRPTDRFPDPGATLKSSRPERQQRRTSQAKIWRHDGKKDGRRLDSRA